MKLIGITGGIGAGKSIICKVFEVMGVPYYSADDRAKWLQNNNQELKTNIQKLIGDSAYLPDGSLNRSEVAKVVFKDQEKLEKLNQLVHPAVANDFKSWCLQKENEGYKFILKEAALLFETGSYKLLDANILVVANKSLRIKRVLHRDNHRTEEDIENIIQKQLSDDQKIPLANHIIHNDESISIVKQCVALHKSLSL